MNVGIIGCSGHYRFAVESTLLHKSFELRAVAGCADGTDHAPLRALAAEQGIPFYEDWKDMLAAVPLDLVEVDCRYDLHASVAAACLREGLHVYCEKPLATNFSDLRMLEDAWKRSGRALGGMFNLRFSSWFLAARRAIDAGEIGDIRMIHGQKSYKLGVRPDFFRTRAQFGGLIPWVAIHALDWALALGGSCKRVSALHSARENRGLGDLEMTAVIQMELEDEILATASADYLRPLGAARHDDDRIRVTGTRGMIEVIDGCAFLENDLPRRALPLPAPGDPFGEFLRAIESGDDARWARQALDSTRVSLLARRAADERCTLPGDLMPEGE